MWSPTNIGMSLLSTMAAHDLGYIRTDEMVRRLDDVLTTLEGLERYNGHFLNWYDTSTRAPLHPRYVSTVDSGNLAASLVALAQGIVTVGTTPQTQGRKLAGLIDTAEVLHQSSASDPSLDGTNRQAITAINRLARDIVTEARALIRGDTNSRLELLANSLLEAANGLDDGEHTLTSAGDVRFWSRAVANAVSALNAQASVPQVVLDSIARRASALANDMRFDFLYDRRRRIFSIGYRLPDADGPGGPDGAFYDLLASEARLASFVAIAKGDVPQHHWFHLGRLVTNVNGQATLMSWGGTMFEYLMPLLLMRGFPGTLLDQSCHASVRRQIQYGNKQGVPWGISESAYTFTDRAGNYQYRAFGVPGLGLKRGLSDDLVVAPYASALASLIDPGAAAANFRRLAREGLDARFGFYEAIEYRPRTQIALEAKAQTGESRPELVRAFFSHHQGMSLVALANVVCDDVFVSRFHADPRVQATELLLQERVPREAILSEPRPSEGTTLPPSIPVLASRRFRTPHTASPHSHFLSNGRYTTALTHAGGGFSTWRGLAVTRQREDRTSDAGAQYIYLRDPRSGRVWSPTYQPICSEPDEY
jgi:cyclic beta-1,2-glucan synthetase